MPAPVSKLTYGVLIGLTLVFSIVATGLASNILIRYTYKFPSQKIGSLTRLAEFGSVWTLLFAVVMAVGTFAAPTAGWSSTFLQSIVFFVAFLVNIVAAAAFSQRDRLFGFKNGADAGMSGVSANLKALEAFLWLDTFFTLFLAIYTFFKHQQITDDERAERLKHSHA